MTPHNEVIDQILPVVGRNLADSECLQPVFFIGTFGEDGKVGIFAADMSSNEAKNETAHAVREIVGQIDADYVLMVAESWVYDASKDEAEAQRVAEEGLADNPLSKEVVMLRYETPTETWTAMADILPERKMGEVKWCKVGDGEEKGRFTGFFSRKAVH